MPNRRGYKSTVVHRECDFCGSAHTHEGEVPPDTFCDGCNSPLFLAPVSQADDSCRRAIMRIPSEPTAARTGDVSLSGMKFYSDRSLPVGQLIKIDSPLLRAVARVIRSQPDGSGWSTGVQFVSLFFEHSRGSFVRVIA